jgi:radical SAM superfamily enzyme YgiQ (UPF0313 family)
MHDGRPPLDVTPPSGREGAVRAGDVPAARVTLVRPPILQLGKSMSAYGAIPPIGLAYIAAVLRDAGHAVDVIDAAGEALSRYEAVQSPVGTLQLNGLNVDAIVERIDPASEVLGISHMFLHEWPLIRELCIRAKARLPHLTVVIGGENATAFWKQMFEQTDAVDYCVLGEGEATMLELVARIKTGRSVEGMSGLASRDGTRTEDASLPDRLTRLGEIPRPAWELFPMDRYMEVADNHGVHRGRSIPMIATRGCPYRCTFCSSPQMWTTKYQTRDPRDVVDEIKSYVERYGVDNVNFCDLTAVIKKDWIVEFCEILKEDRLDITWQLPTGTRTEALDAEVLQLLFETGCRNITYAPESGSERMLKVLEKRVKLPRMLDSFRAAHRAGIITRINIIIGHPLEEPPDTRASFRLLLRVAWAGCQDAAVMIFAPYPGSADFEMLMERGAVEMDEDYYYLALARSGASTRTYNPHMGSRKLMAVQLGMLLAFYATAYLTRPWRILNLIWSQLTGSERTQLDQFVRTKRRQLLPFAK